MTVLGQHSIAEVRFLMRTAEFRIHNAQETLLDHLPFSQENVKLVKEWDEFVDGRWRNAHDKILSDIVKLKLVSPLVPEDLIPAEAQYQAVIKALNAQGESKVVAGDLSDLIRRLETASGIVMDESANPMPNDWDPDLAAFQQADAAIKSGEAAVSALENALPNASVSIAARIPWYVWGVGLAVVGGVGYSVVKTGQQVKAKADRDTKYINENLTSKALPGYKG